uniref:Uncharacterized protein n=1 Tax=Anguilla anguilla TaxID=7936 RepID=A0A0E9PE64_ANGAN
MNKNRLILIHATVEYCTDLKFVVTVQIQIWSFYISENYYNTSGTLSAFLQHAS